MALPGSKEGVAESEPVAHRGLPQEEALGEGKEDFKPSISQKAETGGSCTGKEENRGDLNSSEPAERDEEGEKHHRNETVPATFRRQSKENLSQETKKRVCEGGEKGHGERDTSRGAPRLQPGVRQTRGKLREERVWLRQSPRVPCPP